MQHITESLKKHVLAVWGGSGKQWLEKLPSIIQVLQSQWGLSDIKPIEFPSYNYVAFAMQGSQPVVLKISCDAQLIADEYRTHEHFDCPESVNIFEYDRDHHALLMDRAVPGDTLNEQPRQDIASTIQSYAGMLLALQACDDLDKHQDYPQLVDTLKAIERLSDKHFDRQMIQVAQACKNNLLKTIDKQSICHADLHGGNIILNGDQWLAIDPKGVVADIGYEAAAFDLLAKDALKHTSDPEQSMKAYVGLLAASLHYDPDRLMQWFFVRSMLSSQWFIEDNMDATTAGERADLLFQCLNDL